MAIHREEKETELKFSIVLFDGKDSNSIHYITSDMNIHISTFMQKPHQIYGEQP